MLRDGERCVCDLQDELDAAQSRLSFHLKVLREAGLVTDRKEGRWSYYTLVPEALAEAHDLVVGLRPASWPVARVCRCSRAAAADACACPPHRAHVTCLVLARHQRSRINNYCIRSAAMHRSTTYRCLHDRIARSPRSCARSTATRRAECWPPASAASCCGPVNSCCGGDAFNGSVDPITSNLYVNGETDELPSAAVLASLGCGNPTALAELDGR